MGDHLRVYISPDSFATSFPAFRRSMGLGSSVEQVQLSAGKPIALYTLLCEVLAMEGCHVVCRTRSRERHSLSSIIQVTRTRLWPEIAARLGFATATQSAPVWSNQSIAGHLKSIYEQYLLPYEEGLVENAAREVVSRWWTQHAANPSPYHNGARIEHWVEVMFFSKEEITERGVPKDLVDTLEHWRPVFGHFLRNLDERRKRDAWAAGQVKPAQATQSLNEATQYDQQQAPPVQTTYHKRHRASSPASSTSSGLSYDGPRAEKRPRVDPRVSPCDSSDDTRVERGTPIRTRPTTQDAQSESDIQLQPPQNMQPADIARHSVRKPTTTHRPPNAEETRDAKLWMTLYRQELLDKGASH